MNCGDIIKCFDFISNKVELTINKRHTRLKTIVGGIISSIAILAMLSFALYFFIKFLEKDSLYVTSSMKYSENTTITDSNNFPFLIRLTDKDNKPFPNPESIYSIYLKYWYTDDTNANFKQHNEEIKIEPCDINRHFNDRYKNLFVDNADLQTFFCAVPRPENMTIFGKYGDLSRFGYYHFYITKCIDGNGNEGVKCQSKEDIEAITENIYLDFRTIDFSMDSKNNSAKNSTVLSHRHMLSHTVYKRIWFYLSEIDYITDDGFFFISESTDYFSKYDSMRYDIDLRNISTGTIPETFATMTILSTGMVYIYNRKYLKIQEYLASIGGIIVFIQKIASLVNLLYSMNTYYIHFINELNLFNPVSKGFISQCLDTSNQNLVKLERNADPNLNPNQHAFNSKFDVIPFKPKTQMGLTMKRTMIKRKIDKWYFKFIPFQCNSKDQANFFGKCVDTISYLTNIIMIIKKIEENQLFAKSIFLERTNNKTCNMCNECNECNGCNTEILLPNLYNSHYKHCNRTEYKKGRLTIDKMKVI